MKLKCRRCKSQTLSVTEYETFSRQRRYLDGIEEYTERRQSGHGDWWVSACCEKCGFAWKLRNIRTLDEIEI
jgi:hypothetical protein